MRKRIWSPAARTAAIAIAALAIAVPAAGAATITPAKHDFGSQQLNTNSAVKEFTLRATCLVELGGVCVTPEIFPVAVSATGDFAQTNNCPTELIGALLGTDCVVRVTFTPRQEGVRTGTLSAGPSVVASLTGRGVVKSAGTSKCKKGKRKKAGKKSAAAAKKKKGKCKPKKKRGKKK